MKRTRGTRIIIAAVLLLSALAGIAGGAVAHAAGTWTATASMSAAREGQTATLLPNGKVLVAGGGTNSVPLASAELYDPATGTWSPTGSMNVARYYHTATLLNNGEVLVVGGYGSAGAVSSAELYNPTSGTWTATGSMSAPRYVHTATLLNNGEVLVAGGYTGSATLQSAEVYNPATGIWSATGSMAATRFGHTATLLGNGRVLVTGGGNNVGVLAAAEIYDPTSGTWTGAGSMNSPRYYHTATLLSDGKVLIAGGNDSSGTALTSAQIYDPATGTWTATGSMSTARSYHTATLLNNGKVLVAGGLDSSNTVSPSAELYDPSAGAWTTTGTMTVARTYHAATLLSSGQVLVTGGNNGGDLASAELYTPQLVNSASITLAPANQTGYTGHSVTLSATVIENGNPVQGYGVTFKVISGPDANVTSTTVTNNQGVATFQFTGSTAAPDTVQASYTDSDGNLRTSSTATVTWVVDATAPSCVLKGTTTYINPSSPYNGNKEIMIAMQDTGSGLGKATVAQLTNTTLVPASSPADTIGGSLPITAGQTTEFDEGAVKKNTSLGSQVGFTVKDQAGNTTTCDPVMTSAIRSSGAPSTDSVQGIGQADHLVHVYNDQQQGVENLTVTVNGQSFALHGLSSNQQATLEIGSALQSTNQVSVTTTGKPGGSATLLFGNI